MVGECGAGECGVWGVVGLRCEGGVGWWGGACLVGSVVECGVGRLG